MEISVKQNQSAYSNLSPGALSCVFSNLAKGSEKQYRPEEAGKFEQLAKYFKNRSDSQKKQTDQSFADLAKMSEENINNQLPAATETAKKESDRGAQRALLWGEKVTKIVSSLLTRFEKKGEELLADKNLYVCEICGFIYLGEEAPEICPVCKVPRMKIRQIKKQRK